MEGDRRERSTPKEVEAYSRAVRFYRLRREGIGHYDEEMQAWVAQNERDMLALLRERGRVNPVDHAGAMADIARLMEKHEDARNVFFDAAGKVYAREPQEEQTEEGVLRTMEESVQALAEGDAEFAARLRVELVSAKRRTLEELPKIAHTWATIIARRADDAAYNVFKDRRHGHSSRDEKAVADRAIAAQVRAVYLLQKLFAHR